MYMALEQCNQLCLYWGSVTFIRYSEEKYKFGLQLRSGHRDEILL